MTSDASDLSNTRIWNSKKFSHKWNQITLKSTAGKSFGDFSEMRCKHD